jgi:hypothetical protein
MPLKWNGKWSAIQVFEMKGPRLVPNDLYERFNRIAVIEDWVFSLIDRRSTKIEAAAVEGLAYSKRSSSAHEMAGLWWFVVGGLCRNGMVVHVVTPDRARSVLGKVPRKDRKLWAHQILYKAGAPKTWGPDTLDAFLVANSVVAEIGKGALICR